MLACLIISLQFVFQEPQPIAATKPPSLSPEKLSALQSALAGVIEKALPAPLYQGDSHWGETKRVANGLQWNGKGIIRKPELQYGDKNHGIWRKYLLTLDQPAQEHLHVLISDARMTGNNTLAFTLRIDADVHFDITQQNWRNGVKWFDGSIRGKVHATMQMRCESHLVIAPSESFLPTLKYRLRVSDAKTSYSGLKVNHLAGLGGEMAEKLGAWSHEVIQQWKPSVERNLIEKLNKKIVKAADSKEIQISLDGIQRKGNK